MSVSVCLCVCVCLCVSVFYHSTTLVPGRAAAAPGSATPELDSTVYTHEQTHR